MSNIIFKTLLLKGEAGNNIQSIEKTATSGIVDTYTITLTDGSTSTFEVTNGKNSNDANLATVEDTDYASRRYAVGDFMIYQDKYYKVNQEITAGELISTNKLRLTDVGTQLKDLETDQGNNDKNFRALVSLMYYNNTGTTADKNYRAGERFILNDRLCEALTDITAGDTFFTNLNIRKIDIYELPKLYDFNLPSFFTQIEEINQFIASIGKYEEGVEATSFTGDIVQLNAVPVGEITLFDNDNGTWIFEGVVEFETNTTGYRGLAIGSASPSKPLVRVAPLANVETRAQITKVINVSGITTERKYYLYAYQNSGATLSGSLVEFRATKQSP